MLCRIYVLVIIAAVNAAIEDEIKVCRLHNVDDGFPQTMDCQNEKIQNIPKIKYKDYVKYLDLRHCPNLIFKADDWETYVGVFGISISDVPMSKQRGQVPPDKFMHVGLVFQILVFENSELTDEEMWVLPNILKNYTVDNNLYTNLDISTCPQLVNVSANNNKLKKILFSKKAPPIQRLLLENNPMDELFVKDIAPLCQLKELRLKFPSGSFLTTGDGSCRCQQLEKWIKAFDIAGSNFQCDDPYTDEACDLTFADLKALRQPCGDDSKLPLPASAQRKSQSNFRKYLIFYIVGGILLFLLLLLVLSILAYRAVKAGKSWRESMGGPGEIRRVEEEEEEGGEEEGEEELKEG